MIRLALGFAIAAALVHAQADLGGQGVWSPRAIPDIASGGEHKIDVPFEPWAKARFEENRAHSGNDTVSKCLPEGVPRITFTANAFEIVQLVDRIEFLYEGGTHIWRTVWMDGRTHPKEPNPTWMGDAIGHWDGATLVVDSTGFNDRTWLDAAGHPHSEKLHLIERYTRTGPRALRYEITVDDPGAYTQTWSVSTTIPFKPGGTLKELICVGGKIIE